MVYTIPMNQPAADKYYLIHQVRFQLILKTIEQLNLPPSAKILDIGCFPLYLFEELEKKGHHMHGVASHHEPVTNERIAQLNIEKEGPAVGCRLL